MRPRRNAAAVPADAHPPRGQPAPPDRRTGAVYQQQQRGDGAEVTPVARRTATGWRVGDEEVPDLTRAMVLSDLLAADLPTEAIPVVRTAGTEPPDAQRLQQTVAQLERALTARVRVEQAIGVLAERHRLRPRQAFELLRSAARARGRRVFEMAAEVVDSASNPLLRIPEELAKPPATRRRGRLPGPTLG